MPFLIAGLLLLWFASVAMKGFVRANPVTMARMVRKGGTLAALAGALVMLLRGRIDMALGLLGLGFWLNKSGRSGKGPFGFAQARRARKVSRVRSAMIEMGARSCYERDVRYGAGGSRRGSRARPSRPGPAASACGSAASPTTPEGARLLEAYFDRRFAGWREAADRAGDTGSAGATGGRSNRPGFMSEDEAHEVLGLPKRASREEITRAHRMLMKKFHPDHGGSTDFAARVNEAKDVLMRRHP